MSIETMKQQKLENIISGHRINEDDADWLRAAIQPSTGQVVPQQIKDHVIAQTVNKLRDVAIVFHGTQQLRERIAEVIVPLLKQPP